MDPEDASLEVEQGHKEYWRQITAATNCRYRGYDVEDIPIKNLHVDENRLTCYTQWTYLDSLDNMADIFVWSGQICIEAAMFSVTLTLFDGIILEYGADGLCAPGIGV